MIAQGSGERGHVIAQGSGERGHVIAQGSGERGHVIAQGSGERGHVIAQVCSAGWTAVPAVRRDRQRLRPSVSESLRRRLSPNPQPEHTLARNTRRTQSPPAAEPGRLQERTTFLKILHPSNTVQRIRAHVTQRPAEDSS